MKRMILGVAAAALLVGGASAKSRVTRAERSESAAAPVGKLDGAWVIDAATTVGACPGLVPQTITIRDGKVTDASGVSPWGYVEGDGTFVARFTTQSGHMARTQGRLGAGGGSGAWSSNTDMCGGTWRAARSTERAAQ